MKEKEYVRVDWPESQEYMEYEEFIYASPEYDGLKDEGLRNAGFIPKRLYKKDKR